MLVAGPGGEGDFMRAIAVSDSLLANCVMSDTLKAFIMIERDVAMLNAGLVERGMSYSDTLIAFGKKTGIPQAQMQGEQGKGVCYRRTGLHDKAIDCYRRGLDISIAHEDTEWEQVFSEMLAITYTEIGRTKEALEFALRSRRLAEELGDPDATLAASSTIGSILTKEERYAEAIESLRPYTRLADKAIAPARVKFLTPLFSSYMAVDSLDATRRILLQMEDAVSRLPAGHQATGAYLTAKAVLLGKERRYNDQWKVFQTIDSLGTHGKAANVVRLERAQCLANMGDFRRAYDKVLDAYTALDSVRHSDIDRELSDLSVRYDTLNKEIEIERLSRQHWILVSVVLFCILLLGILVILAVSKRRKHLLRARQEKQQEYIRGLEQERARMARELHDDVAGDLVGLQFELPGLTPDRSAARVQEIAEKVRRLSHELMPPQFISESLTSLLIDYARAHNQSHPSRRIVLTDEGSFDWNSLTPEQNRELYRIVQEAVNNAMKHSATENISVTLDGNDKFSLSITNDGVKHAAPADRSGGIGMQTLKARASIIGAYAEATVKDNTYTLTIHQK